MDDYLRFLDAWPQFGPFLSFVAVVGGINVLVELARALRRR